MAKTKKPKKTRRYRYVAKDMLAAWVKLYREGKSLAVIGKKYDRNPSVVRGALLRAKVKLRSRGGAPVKKAKKAKS